jgi:hypothetical protein
MTLHVKKWLVPMARDFSRQKAQKAQRGRAAPKKDVLDRMNRIYRIRLGPCRRRSVLRNPVHPVHPVNFFPKMNDSDGLRCKIGTLFMRCNTR